MMLEEANNFVKAFLDFVAGRPGPPPEVPPNAMTKSAQTTPYQEGTHMKSPTDTRMESDLLGAVAVPTDALYGAQTQRAIENFPLGAAPTLGGYPAMVEALALIKQAAASANLTAGLLDESKAAAIIQAARHVLDRRPFDQFPIHRLHGGGGTSANMNANEVLANLAEESLGGARGEYRLIHPNDHVNLNQSTNDVYPTACHIAVIRDMPALDQALGSLADAFSAKVTEFGAHPRLARTCLQDAVAIRFSDLFGGYAGLLQRSRNRIADAVDSLHSVNLGGTIVGRESDVPPAYFQAIIPALREATGDAQYRRAPDLFDAAQNPDDLVAVSAALDLLARGLIKICKDLRLMSSGPEAGLGEITLPAVQPGSSIMPGKINPVIPEFAIQLCFQTLGNHAACVACLDHGELDLNVWESCVVFNILDSLALLANAASTLAGRCIGGLGIDVERNARNAQTIIPLLTELMTRHGYSAVSDVCKQAGGDIARLRALLAEAFPEE